MTPLHSYESEGINIEKNVFAGLVDYNWKTLAVVPAIATSWDHNADNTVFTFHLRSGVKFQPGQNGEDYGDVTAETFVKDWGIACAKDTASEVSYILEPIEGFAACVGIQQSGAERRQGDRPDHAAGHAYVAVRRLPEHDGPSGHVGVPAGARRHAGQGEGVREVSRGRRSVPVRLLDTQQVGCDQEVPRLLRHAGAPQRGRLLDLPAVQRQPAVPGLQERPGRHVADPVGPGEGHRGRSDRSKRRAPGYRAGSSTTTGSS